MGNAAITGTPTSTGGAVMPSANNQLLTIEGSTVALIGDYASCQCGLPYCKKTGPIVANPALPRAVFYNQIPWALAGDFVATGCGLCTILESPHEVMVGHDMSSAVHIPAGVKISIVNGMSFNMGPATTNTTQATQATATAMASATTTPATHAMYSASSPQTAMAAQGVATAHTAADANSTATNTDSAAHPIPKTADGWQIVKGISPDNPMMVYQTEKMMFEDIKNTGKVPKDLQYCEENKEEIKEYGFLHPFTEDDFALSSKEHFRRMRGLGSLFSNAVAGYLGNAKTTDTFFDMVNKFERNEGGFFHDNNLTAAMKDHDTTKQFHKALKICLRKNINSDGSLPHIKQLQKITSYYMKDIAKVSLPKFGKHLISFDLINGTVLTTHDIWAMQVYTTQLEYKGKEIRGVFHYKIEDHFGLDSTDINHTWKDPFHNYEFFDGFRSWYILQHYEKHGFKPFVTTIDFTL